MEFQGLINILSRVLTGWGVLVISALIALILGVVYKRNKSRQLLNSLPGLFTSLGLLGTFVAICNSLGSIDQDTLEIDVIIRDLIPAFTSSIAGLVGAFIATVVCKVMYSYEDKKIDDKVELKTPEECLYELTTLSTKTNEKLAKLSNQLDENAQMNALYNDRLNTTMGQQSKILEQFINDFVKRMDDIFVKMHGQIEQNIKEFGEEQFKKCADTLEDMTSRLSALSVNLLEGQKSNVEQMIAGTNTELQAMSNTVTQQLSTLCLQMNDALSSLRSSQDARLTAIVENYDALSERMANQNAEFVENINEKMKNEYEFIQQYSINSLQQMVDLKESYTEVNQSMLQSTTDMNKEVTTELRNSLTVFVDQLRNSISEEITLLQDSIRTNVTELERSYTYISDHVANIKGNYESAADLYIDVVNKAHRMNESQEKMLSTINDSLSHVAKTNERIDEVYTLLEERQDRIENLVHHINELTNTIELLQKLESQLNRIANK